MIKRVVIDKKLSDMDIQQARFTNDLVSSQAPASFESTWASITDLPLNPVGTGTLSSLQDLSILGAVAWIGGTWTGNIAIMLPKQLSLRIYRSFFSVDCAKDDDLADIAREIVNMTAGHIKSSIPGLNALALPGSFGTQSIPTLHEGMHEIVTKNYMSSGFPITLSVSALELD